MELKSQLMSTDEIIRALKRISHQIAEKNSGAENLIIVGIKNGGMPIAEQLRLNLEAMENIHIPIGSLDIRPHRDDIKDTDAHESTSSIPVDITGKIVVLVDDVLCTGRTARAALDGLSKFGRAKGIQLAVLIDRGHRELPIRADYVGKNIPTSKNETVSVDFDSKSNLPVVNIYDI